MCNLTRFISQNGEAVITAIDSTKIVSKIEQIHKTSAVVTAALGRLSTAASIMGYLLKSEGSTITLRLNGGGATGSLIAVSNHTGNVKSYVANPIVELPLNQYGKLDVKGAVGTDGTLSVIKDLGLKEPYIGQVPIVSGEIAEDITYYYATSEQTPTVCGLGVLVNPDLTVRAAGGYLLQLLPFASEETIKIIEQNVDNILPISTLIDSGNTPEDVCKLLLDRLNPNILDSTNTEYYCDCSKDRITKALLSLGKTELLDMATTDHSCNVECHFCEKEYFFTEQELMNLTK